MGRPRHAGQRQLADDASTASYPRTASLNPDNQPVDFFPVVLGTYAATYLGIAAGCFDHLLAHIAGRRLADGRRMGDVETIRSRVADCKVEIERSRALLYAACAAFDEGRHGGPLPFFEAKVACDELGAFVTGEAMTLGGGAAFAKRLPFERYFRDARAGHGHGHRPRHRRAHHRQAAVPQAEDAPGRGTLTLTLGSTGCRDRTTPSLTFRVAHTSIRCRFDV